MLTVAVVRYDYKPGCEGLVLEWLHNGPPHSIITYGSCKLFSINICHCNIYVVSSSIFSIFKAETEDGRPRFDLIKNRVGNKW